MNVESQISFTINGKLVTVSHVAGETLAMVLRDRLHLIGTKIGCNESECGACTVLVNGQPILSCTYPAARAQGKDILTIEGLAQLYSEGKSTPALHPLQQAFIDYGAVQCGF